MVIHLIMHQSVDIVLQQRPEASYRRPTDICLLRVGSIIEKTAPKVFETQNQMLKAAASSLTVVGQNYRDVIILLIFEAQASYFHLSTSIL